MCVANLVISIGSRASKLDLRPTSNLSFLNMNVCKNVYTITHLRGIETNIK